MIKKTLEIVAEEGLHARPASQLAKVAIKFKCDLKMYREGNTSKLYQPKSILSIMSLGASKGDRITFEADGIDEVEALELIGKTLINQE